VFFLPLFRQTAQGEAHGAGGKVWHAGFGEHEEAAVLDDETESLGALLLGPANPFVAVDEFHGGGPPDEDGRPALPVMHDLNERAPHLAPAAQIVLAGQGRAHPLHFPRQRRPHFQFAKNHRAGLAAAPRCHRVGLMGCIHPTQPEPTARHLSSNFSKSLCWTYIRDENEKAVQPSRAREFPGGQIPLPRRTLELSSNIAPTWFFLAGVGMVSAVMILTYGRWIRRLATTVR
jgi:hypothetical protein